MKIIRVKIEGLTPELHEIIQPRLFAAGFLWSGRENTIRQTQCPYLIARVLTRGNKRLFTTSGGAYLADQTTVMNASRDSLDVIMRAVLDLTGESYDAYDLGRPKTTKLVLIDLTPEAHELLQPILFAGGFKWGMEPMTQVKYTNTKLLTVYAGEHRIRHSGRAAASNATVINVKTTPLGELITGVREWIKASKKPEPPKLVVDVDTPVAVGTDGTISVKGYILKEEDYTVLDNLFYHPPQVVGFAAKVVVESAGDGGALKVKVGCVTVTREQYQAAIKAREACRKS